MAVSSGFFNSQNGDRKYNAEQMSSIFDGILIDGVYSTIGTCFKVTASTGNTVNVGIGRAWFNHAWIYNDAALPITLEDSDILLNRYDAIVIEINHSLNVRAGSIKVVKGTPSSSPQKPALTKNDQVNQYPLCYILRTAESTSISSGNIENTVGTDECPYASTDVAGLTEQINQKVDTSDIANNLTTTTAGKVLDARQGKILNDKFGSYYNKTETDSKLGTKLSTSNVVNNLTTTSSGKALDARQGKTLNDKFGSYVPLSGTTNMKGAIRYPRTSSNVTFSARYASSANHDYQLIWGGSNTGSVFFLWDVNENRSIFGYDRNPEMFYINVDQTRFGRGKARLSSANNQQCYIWASDEAGYAVGLGVFSSGWRFMPNRNDGAPTLGAPNNRWGQLYSITGSINTSDRNLKKDIHTLDEDKMYTFVKSLDPVGYKFIENSHGRQHFGMIAQQVEEAMTECGLTDMDFAGFIRDNKVNNVYNDDGTIKEQIPIEGEYTYSLRYEEFIAPIISAVQHQAKLIEKLNSRITELESLVQ